MRCTELKEGVGIRRGWAVALIGLVVLLLYGRTYSYGLIIGDDTVNITYNPFYDPLTVANILQAWSKAYFDLFIPVTLSIWFFLQRLARLVPGISPQGLLHAANLMFHWANGVLVFFLAGKVLAPPRRSGAWHLPELACALFFVAHPLQVPVTAWVSGLRDLAAAFFSLLALHAVIRAEPTALRKNGGLELATRSFAAYLGATLLFVLALLSKPSAVCLPLLAVIVCAMLGRNWRATLGALVPWFLISAIVCWATAGLQVSKLTRYEVPLGLRPFAALDVLGFYAGKVLLPYPILNEYDWHSLTRSDGPAFWLSALAMAALVGLGIRFKARVPILWLGLLFALVALLPVLGFVPYLHQQLSDVGSRYMYFPLVGLGLALGAAVKQGLNRSWQVVAGGVLLVVFSTVSYRLVPDYANDDLFYGSILEYDSENAFAHTNLGLSLLQRGQFEKALTELGVAYRNDPDSETNRINLLVARMLGGHSEEVFEEYRAQLQQQPGNSAARFEAGNLLVLVGQVPEGVRLLQQAVTADARFARVHCPPAEQIAFLHPDHGLLRSRLAQARRLSPDLECLTTLLEHLERNR